MGNYSKAIAAFIMSLLTLAAMFGVSTDWATPSLVDGVAVLIGTLITTLGVVKSPANVPSE